MPPEGILFVGERGAIMAGFFGQDPQLFAKGKREPLGKETAAPHGPAHGKRDPGGRYTPWVRAVKGGEPSPGNFLSAAAITDTVNLGTVALRAGRKVHFQSDSMTITNAPDANRFLRRQYRPGWEL
jgi:hypothetical protein